MRRDVCFFAVCFLALIAGCGPGESPESGSPVEDRRVQVEPVTLPTESDFPLDTLEPAVRAQFDAAMSSVRKAPHDAGAAGRLGMLFHTYEMYELAERCYAHAVAMDPGVHRWHYYHGMVLAHSGNLEASRRAFSDALKLKPDDTATLLRLGFVALERGDADAALERFGAVVALDSNAAPAFYGAGKSLMMRGDIAAATERFERAIGLASVYGKARYALALAYRKADRLEEAAEQFRLADEQREMEAWVADPLAEALDGLTTGAIDSLHKGIDLVVEHRVAEAIPLLEEALRSMPQLAEAHANLGTAFLLQGDLDRATRHLERAISLHPGYVQAYYNLGLVSHRREDFAGAVRHFEKSLSIQPDHYDALVGLGTDLPRIGRRTEAIDRLRRAIELRGTEARPCKRLASLLVAGGAYGDAIDVLRAGIQRLPNDASLADRLAWLLATCPDDSLRDPLKAIRIANAVAKRTKHRIPRTLDTLAAALAAGGRFEEAVRVAEGAKRMADASGKSDLAGEIAGRIKIYQEKRAYLSPDPGRDGSNTSP